MRPGQAKPYPEDLYAGCPCYTCDKPAETWGSLTFRTRMSVCPTCGNKRCPGAADHSNACTQSNDAGQPGSLYA